MAFRIHESVIRGEIDNRVKGVVRGRIFLVGRSEPIALDLKGNASQDLAGCLLTFKNTKEPVADEQVEALAAVQRGTVGDITASQKVRVFDIPLEDALAMIRRKEKPPEHLANSLYLEWFSDANGRVVIQSSDYGLTISTPEWRLNPEDEQERADQAVEGMANFMDRLTEAIEEQQRDQKDPEEPWDEFDYEKFLKESDARTDKYGELLDKYGDSPDAQAKIDHEMGWDRELTEEEAEEQRRRIEEINEACEQALNEPEPDPDPQREGIDWIRREDGDLAHPLQHRCLEGVIRLDKTLNDLGLEEAQDKYLDQFAFELQVASAKLAGALGPLARGYALPEPAFTVAYLKRALDHLHKSQAGLAGVASRKLLPEQLIAEWRQELLEIREGILKLMDEHRGR